MHISSRVFPSIPSFSFLNIKPYHMLHKSRQYPSTHKSKPSTTTFLNPFLPKFHHMAHRFNISVISTFLNICLLL